jgi:hypothetical protein
VFHCVLVAGGRFWVMPDWHGQSGIIMEKREKLIL